MALRFLTGWWRRPGVRFWVLLIPAAVLVFGATLVVGAWFNVCAPVDACPSIASLESYDPDQASKVYAADGRLVTDLGLERRTVVPLREISPAAIAAFLTVEDHRFYRHPGVDPIGILAALKPMLRLKRPRGFSTITMQLAGNLWPAQIDRRQRMGLSGVTRKLREMRMALEIERNYSKDRILELYLNQIDLGNRAFGVEAAAQRYFGKSARQLNVAEAALLAGLPQAPSRYNPRRNPDLAVWRRNVIISLLRESGKLAPESAEAWKSYPLALSSRSDYSGVAEYYVEFVRQQLEARFGMDLYRAGYRVYTHLDLDMQTAAERALQEQLDRIEEGKLGAYRHPTYRDHLEKRAESDDADNGSPFSPYLQGAIVSIEPATGYIRALVGGRDFADSKFNRVIQANRQAGSTFKPFVYAAAIRNGLPLSKVYVDSLISIEIPDQPLWEPNNYDLKFQGPMSMRRGLFMSRNTIAIQVGLEVGIDAVVSEAANEGITSRIPRVPSIFIGSAEVTPLELTAAYGTFANLGVRVAPNAILRVEDRQGNIVWQPEIRSTRVIDPEHAWLILDGLRDVVRRGTAHSSVVAQGFTLPAAGKTGTTNDGMDVWFVGFTPDLVTGVWMGFDKKQPIKSNAQGGLLAAPAWTAMMKEVYQRRRVPEEWRMPEGLIAVEIDRSSGYLSTPDCPHAEVGIEYFYPGTEPTERCPLHRRGPFFIP